MPKKTEEKTIRNIELHPETKKELEKIIALSAKKSTGSKDEVMESFFEVFEGDNSFAKNLVRTGIETKSAQKWACMTVNCQLGKKITNPVYDVFLNVSSKTTSTFEDEKTKKKYPIVTMTGGVILVNQKNGNETDEKLGEVTSYRNDTEKVDIIEVGQVYKLEAATGNVKPHFLTLKVDDRCGTAVKDDRKMTDITKLQTQLYDVTPIGDKMSDYSKHKGDLKLIEGLIESIRFPKGKNFANVSIMDLSVDLDKKEKESYDANLTVLANKEIMSGIGKESIVRMLGNMNYENSEEYGEQVTLLFPKMINPIMLIEPEVYESSAQVNDDDAEDASEYFTEDETPAEVEEEKTESEPETKVEDDKYSSVKEHECVKNGDFGDPEDEPSCNECEKSEPNVYKLCNEKKEELKTKK